MTHHGSCSSQLRNRLYSAPYRQLHNGCRRLAVYSAGRHQTVSKVQGGCIQAVQPSGKSHSQVRKQSVTAKPVANHTSTYREDKDVLDGNIKVIGLGQRGISATLRLQGNAQLHGAEFWVLDSDAKTLASCGITNTIAVLMEDEAQPPAAELDRLAGEAATAAAAWRPSSPTNTCGVVFLLAGAGGIPGGPTLLLQLSARLRRTGFFVVCAITRPFDFEGRRKLEEADALIEALQDVAHLVVVVPQGVLMRTSTELTISEASAIADNTLEVSCRTMLWALGAPEVLRVSKGIMLWHGRDLRQYKRLLSPPLEVLLTCPGIGGLGRGLASLPVALLDEAGFASGLSTLAEDAVAAAVESPFLDGVVPNASGVLCVLSLPGRVLNYDLDIAPGALNDPEKYAIRAAVQVAALTVVELAGKQCEQVVVCAHIRADWPHTEPDLLCMEATLLVLEDPAAAEQAAAAAGPASNQSYPYMTPAVHHSSPASSARNGTAASGTGSTGPILHSVSLQQQQRQQQQQQTSGSQVQQQPPAAASSSRSSWSAMSAIAGGSAAAAVGQNKAQGLPSSRTAPLPQGIINGSSIRPAVSQGDAASSTSSDDSQAKPPLVNFFGGRSAAAAAPSSISGASSSGSSVNGGRSLIQSSQDMPASSWQLQKQQSQVDSALVPRMAEKHVDAMVAQSLDLPPSAARWRDQQRRSDTKQWRSKGASHFPLTVVPWSAPGASGSQEPGAEGTMGVGYDLGSDNEIEPPKDVKSRVAGMLQQERQGGWDLVQHDEL